MLFCSLSILYTISGLSIENNQPHLCTIADPQSETVVTHCSYEDALFAPVINKQSVNVWACINNCIIMKCFVLELNGTVPRCRIYIIFIIDYLFRVVNMFYWIFAISSREPAVAQNFFTHAFFLISGSHAPAWERGKKEGEDQAGKDIMFDRVVCLIEYPAF